MAKEEWTLCARFDGNNDEDGDNKDEDNGDDDDDDHDHDYDYDVDYDDDDDDDADDDDEEDGKGEMKSLINLLAWSRHTAPVYYFSHSDLGDDDGDDNSDNDDGDNDDVDDKVHQSQETCTLYLLRDRHDWQSAANQKTNPLTNIFSSQSIPAAKSDT